MVDTLVNISRGQITAITSDKAHFLSSYRTNDLTRSMRGDDEGSLKSFAVAEDNRADVITGLFFVFYTMLYVHFLFVYLASTG